MIEIMGIKYLTDKEATKRYGFSQPWFQYRRSKKMLPKFIRFEGKGRIYYPLDETDNWFKSQLK